jgi:hypothetical protein
VAGRLGYCALDRTRAVLQGDEIRACWQAPSRPEPFEGLFRDLPSGQPVDAPLMGARDEPVTDRFQAHDRVARGATADAALVGTRTWIIPIVPDRLEPSEGDANGLREAPFVPARSIARSPAASTGRVVSDDLELGRIVEDPAVGQGDPHADQAVTDDRALGDTHP